MPTLKELLGADYKDGMTVEEMDTILSAKSLVDGSSVVEKSLFDRTASELSQLKKKMKEIEGANLTAEQQVANALKEAQETKSTYLKELSKVKATEVFIQGGLSEKEYSMVLPGVVTEDAESSITLAKAVVDMVQSQRQAVEQRVKSELLEKTPKPPNGTTGGNYESMLKEAQASNDGAAMAAAIRLQQGVIPK